SSGVAAPARRSTGDHHERDHRRDSGAGTPMISEARSGPLLAVNDLAVEFRSTERVVEAVRGVSFAVDQGETIAIVGESGSGKSVTALSLMRLVEHGGGRITAG